MTRCARPLHTRSAFRLRLRRELSRTLNVEAFGEG